MYKGFMLLWEDMLKLINRWVESLSRVFKIDFKYIFKGGSLLGLTQISSAVSAFVLTIAFANLLPQEDYGIYRYILSAYTLFAIIALPGIDTAMMETIAKGNHGAFIHGIKTKFRWGVFAGLATVIYAIYNFYIGEHQLGILFTITGIAIPFMESLSLYTGFLQSTKRFDLWAITEFINQVVSLAALIGSMYLTHNVVYLIAAYFIAYIVVRLFSTLYVFRNLIQNQQIDMTYLKYGRDMTWFQILSRGIATMDQVVLFHLLGPIQLAVFSIANSIPTRVQSVLRIVGTLALPKFAKQNEKDIVKSLPRKMFYFALAILFVCLVYVLLVPYVFGVLFPKYAESIPYTQVIIFYTLAGIGYPLGAFFTAHRKVKENYWLAVVGFLVKALCLVIFVPLYGIWGAVIGILANTTSTIIGLSIIIKLTGRDKTPTIAPSVDTELSGQELL